MNTKQTAGSVPWWTPLGTFIIIMVFTTITSYIVIRQHERIVELDLKLLEQTADVHKTNALQAQVPLSKNLENASTLKLGHFRVLFFYKKLKILSFSVTVFFTSSSASFKSLYGAISSGFRAIE